MSLVAVVPLRDLNTGKSRLRGMLPDRWRRALILVLMERVVRAVAASGAVSAILIVSPDIEIRRHAERMGIAGLIALPQTGAGLNAALWQATALARHMGASGVLAINADLALVTPESIRALCAAPAELAIAGDRHAVGTNALVVRPPGAVPFRFGEQSFVRHQAEGRKRGIMMEACITRALSFDLDTPADLFALTRTAPVTAFRLAQVVLRRGAELPRTTSTVAAPAPARETHS